MATTASASAGMSAADFFAGGRIAARVGGGEGGKFLGQLLRAAMRTFGILPVGGADEDFAVTVAGLAMKFVDWHEEKIIGPAQISRGEFFAVRQVVAVPAAQGFVAGVCKKKFQRRRFDVAVAKDHVGLALMAGQHISGLFHICHRPSH